MPKRTFKPFRYEAATENERLSPALERRLRKLALDRAPTQVAEWRNAVSDTDRFYAAPSASMAAYMLGEQDLARQLADEAIALAKTHRENWNYGNAIHYGHTVLGLLRLQDHEVERAVAELRESGETTGSPQLNSFGPTMHLARELLRHGQFDAVVLYFQQCRSFWKMGTKWLSIWEKKVVRGAIPNFFGHLYR